MTPHTLTRTATAVPADHSDLVHDIRLRTAAGISNPTQDIPQLLAHIETLQRRLDAAETVLPGITHLTPGEPAELTIYRAECEHGHTPLGLYTNRAAARAHAEHLHAGTGLPAGATATWIPDFGDAEAIEELAVFRPGKDDEQQEGSATGYLIAPLTLTAVYDPEAQR
ncbi:hypothetical protein [Streptomyces zaomyceticus]|uniref:hypothetical protein n=1 Tax=Streptomyces zaomyceticus TaxID=68286 RepID=UPI0036CE7D6A